MAHHSPASLEIDGVEYISLNELSKKVGMSVWHLRELARQSGRCPRGIPGSIRVRGKWFFEPKTAVSALLADELAKKSIDEELDELGI